MQSTSNAALAELLQCSICLDTYTRPKVLPCQHTYCYSCLLALGNKQYTIKCPQCRVVHDIPKEGMASLKDNLLVNNLLSLSIHEEGPKCSDCKEAPVVSVCAHCDSQVCTPCLVHHSELSSELRTSLHEIKENLLSEENRHRLTEKKSRLQESMDVLKNEVGRMKEVFDDAIQSLVKRRNQIESFIDVVLQIYEDLLHASGGSLANTSYMSTLSEKLAECRTTESLRRLKENVSDLKTTSRLIQTRDDHFRFIGEASTLNTETFGGIEFGQAIVDIKAQYEVAGSESETPRDDSESRSGNVETTRRCVATKIMKDVETMTDSIDVNSEHFTHSTTSTGALPDSCTPSGEIRPSQGATESSNPGFCFVEDAASAGPPARAESNPVLARLAQPRYYQNQLPTGVNYREKGNGWITVIGKGKYVQNVSLCLESPAGCAYHVARDEIYVADYDENRIMVYNSSGMNGRVFYSCAEHPYDVAISEDGEYILIAGGTALDKVTVSGELVKTIVSFGQRNLEICCSVAVCQDHHVALLDHNHKCVIVYSDSDQYVRHFGARYLEKPSSVAVDGNGDFYVTDHISSCVHVFKRNGQFLGTFGQLNEDEDIAGITVDGDGFVSVSRRLSDRIDVYDPQRRLFTCFGKPGKRRPGDLNFPLGLCLMPDGRLIVADTGNTRLRIF